jgi:predicted permease
MRSLRGTVMRVIGLIGGRRADQDLSTELDTHLAMHTEDNIRAGMSPEEARRRARIALGGTEQTKEQHRDQRRMPIFDELVQDLRYAIRALQKSPTFAATAILTLALGIGANTAIFSIVDGALLHPIPFPDPDRLVALYSTSAYSNRNAISYLNFLDWQRQNRTFEELAAWRTDTFTLTGRGQAEHLVGVMVSANLFSTLRVPPLFGRTFRPDDDQRGAAPMAMIGEGLWVRRFGRDPQIVGQSLTLNGRDYTVIGVVPSMVRLDRAGASSFANDVFLPLGLYSDPLFLMRGADAGTRGLARLRSGISVSLAKADMDVVATRLARAYPESNRGVGVNVITLKEDVIGDVRRVLWILLGAVGFVLLIACANVANLALARSLGRSQEFAVRSALGAGRVRLVRQLLTENLLLAAAGGTLGIGLAGWITRAALDLLPSALPVMSQVDLNARVLMSALVVSVATGLLFGLPPALSASRPNVDEQLRMRGRGVTAQSRAQRLLVIGQVALTLVLLVGAGLMVRSLVYLLTGSLGFDPQGVVMALTGLPAERRSRPDIVRAAVSDLNDRLAAIPGVNAASVQVGSLPFTGNTTLGFWRENQPRPTTPGEMREALYYVVGPDYFRTMRIPLLRGRGFTRQDDVHHPFIVIVDQELALSVFGSLDVVGQRIQNGFEQTLEVVGVVGHVAHRGLDNDATAQVRSQMYVPYSQLPDSAATLFANELSAVVRSSAAPEKLFTSIRGAVTAFDPNAATHDERTMNDAITASMDRRRFSLVVLGMFAVTALFLSAIGIYGVVAYAVTRRTRDIGIRVALGASRRNILHGLLGESGQMALSGTLLGLLVSIGLSRLIATFLFRVSTIDPLTFGGMALLLLLVTLAASFIPAWRATNVDPLVALRAE